ncbi:MAG TPA: hypothetical protein VF519_17215 [Mycobacteriales bacterium]|jgi:preprotein translocase subunit SecD
MGLTRIPAVLLAAALVATGCAEDEAPEQTATVTFRVTGTAPVNVSGTLRARLEALGAHPGEPRVEGETVTFGVSRKLTPNEANGLARPGHLTFRAVTKVGAPDAKLPGNAGTGNCADETYRLLLSAAFGGPAHDRETTLGCDAEGGAKYVLGPAETVDVTDAEARESFGPEGSSGTWVVSMEVRDQTAWQALTTRYVGKQLAIVLDGIVASAPTVNDPIPDGHAEISGSFDAETAGALAAVLESGSFAMDGVTVSPA